MSQNFFIFDRTFSQNQNIVSPRRPEQWKKIRLEKREKILDTALELFATHGYHGSSVSMIARKAGISKGLLYTYFDNKEHLLREVLANGMDELIRDLHLIPDQGINREMLLSYIELTFGRLKESTRFYQLFFSLVVQPSVLPIFRQQFIERILPLMKLLEKYFEEQGEQDPLAKAYLFIAILDGVGMDYIATGGIYPLEKLKDLFIHLFLDEQPEKRGT